MYNEFICGAIKIRASKYMAPFPRTNFLIWLLIGAWLAFLCSSSSSAMESYVEDACSVTRYPNICIRSLASFSNTAKRDPCKWARAGVTVTIREAKIVSRYVANLKSSFNSTEGKNRNRIAVSDCVELFQDALDVLHSSLYVLRKFTRQSFDGSRMEDVISWLSAALTDEDTCLEGFSSRDRHEVKRIQLLQNRVMNVTYLTSNALALVNKLASTGPPN